MNRFVRTLSERSFSLIVSLPENRFDLAKAAWESGADAIKVHLNLSHRASGTRFERYAFYENALDEICEQSPVPVGVVPGDGVGIVRETFDEWSTKSFDFVSLYLHDAPACVLNMEGMALMMACGSNYDLEEAEEFKVLGIEALEASIIPPDGYGAPLSLRDLLHYRMLVEHSGLPVVVPTQRAILPEEVRALRQVGVSALMIGSIVIGKPATPENIARATEQFRQAIDDTAFWD